MPIVEPQYNILYGDPGLDLDLSEQYLVSDCCTSCGSCGGSWHATALRFVRDEGITNEACFPYTASNCPCFNRCSDWSDRLKTIDETGRVSSNVETIKQYLIEKGPLSVAMGIGSSYGGHFDNGIYRCTNDSGINHGVVIVGYDETENYWIVRNSWGSSWNGDGYFKVGCGECAIESHVYYANLAAPTPTSTPTPTPTPTLDEVFFDSFDDSALSNWVQDAQNDWFCSTQRAAEGSHSAEVDGWADHATLTLKDTIDLSGTPQAILTFSLLIESGLDTGDHLALDLWNGTAWDEVARLSGDVDAEDVWHDEVIDLSDYLIGDFKLRFRGKMSL